MEIVKKVGELPRKERKKILKKYGKSIYRAILRGKLIYVKKEKNGQKQNLSCVQKEGSAPPPRNLRKI